MWPKDFNFFHEFNESFRTLFLFNTIKEYPEGLTYYDLQKIGNFPHSKIYRLMKKLEQEGYLRKEEKVELGRPKHLYLLTDKGLEKLEEIRETLVKFFEFLKTRWPNLDQNFDYNTFLREGTFKIWCSPVEHILNRNISKLEKMEALEGMEHDLTDLLKKIRKEKRLLKNGSNGEEVK